MPTPVSELTPEVAKQEIRTQLNNGNSQRLHWCRKCNVPLLTSTCYRCGAQGRGFVADVKPVFVEERHLLEEILGRELPDYLYASGNRVYYKGKLLFSLSTNGEKVEIKMDHTDVLTTEDVSNTNGRVRLETAVEANIPALRYLEQEAIHSIIDVSQEYPTKKPVISFSGGKDSAVVADLVRKALGDTDEVSLFFCDTTLEHPATEEYVVQFANRYGLPLSIKRATGDFFAMCAELEPPSRIMRWCCTIFKANPLNEYLRETSNVLSFDGIRRRESNRRRNYDRISGNKKALKQLVFRPILEWSTLAVWLYIFAYDILYNPAYDKGYARVGCVICPYSTDYNDFLARRNYPEKVAAWEAMLSRYFQQEYTDKFTPQLADEWIKQGLWKKRKPHHENKQGSVRLPTCPTLKEYAYQLGIPISSSFIEYLKPLGEFTFYPDLGSFRITNVQRFHISGTIGDDLLSISFTKPNFRQDMFLVERQIKKAMNCVRCGACTATCSSQAIEVRSNQSFRINETACNHCLSCVKSDFTHYGCVALSYKRERNWIVVEE
jgi:phosphoadenosine phosphosulfate reductase